MNEELSIKNSLAAKEHKNKRGNIHTKAFFEVYDELVRKSKISHFSISKKEDYSAKKYKFKISKSIEKEGLNVSKTEKSLANVKSAMLPGIKTYQKGANKGEGYMSSDDRKTQHKNPKAVLLDQVVKAKKSTSLPGVKVQLQPKTEQIQIRWQNDHHPKKYYHLIDEVIDSGLRQAKTKKQQSQKIFQQKIKTRQQDEIKIEIDSEQEELLIDQQKEIRKKQDKEMLHYLETNNKIRRKALENTISQFREKEAAKQHKFTSLKFFNNGEESLTQTMKARKNELISYKTEAAKSSLSKSKKQQKKRFFSWKLAQFPFTYLTKIQASKLFSFYLGIKEVTPMVPGRYKVYANDGNNGLLVSRLLKNRGWWMGTDDMSQAHLVWTQLPQGELMNKVNSSQIIKLYRTQVRSAAKSNDAESKAIHSKEEQQIKKFIQHKNNSYFQACSKLLHPLQRHKILHQLSSKFKNNQIVTRYQYLKDILSKTATMAKMTLQAKNTQLFNHCEYSQQIGDKKNLMMHVEKYCELRAIDKNKIIPQTVHISEKQIENILQTVNSRELIKNKLKEFKQEDSLYIIKPGECSNRGNGITVHPSKSALIDHISSSIRTFPQDKTYIVQHYLDPLLYQGRKFDIRVWVLYCNNKLWFYRQGYVRTSCKPYNISNMNRFIHLTNDAVQKEAEEYGKYEPANKVSFNDIDKYLKNTYQYYGFYGELYQRMKKLTKILFEAGMLMIGRTSQQFQLFGLDFIVDREFKVWLIECNSNPCLQTGCSLLNRLVPNMIDNVLAIAVDPYFPPCQKRDRRDEGVWQSQKFNFELLSDAMIENDYLQAVCQNQEYLQVLKSINPHKLSEVNPHLQI